MGGRQKGSQNKSSASVKSALQAVYEKKGGDAALLKWAGENETKFYELWVKMLPQEVSGPDGGALQVINEIVLRGVRSNADH